MREQKQIASIALYHLQYNYCREYLSQEKKLYNILIYVSQGKVFAKCDLVSSYWQIPIRQLDQHKKQETRDDFTRLTLTPVIESLTSCTG